MIITFIGQPPALTVEGRDISKEFAALLGLTQPLHLDDYIKALEARYALPTHRATTLDCCVPPHGYTDKVSLSTEGEPDATSNGAGHVAYLTDLDPRGRLLDLLSPWLNPHGRCYSDSILWRLYQSDKGSTFVLTAHEDRQMEGVVLRWVPHTNLERHRHSDRHFR